jgi:ribosomal protein S18 acetylase RimI-like enzyme
MNIRNARSEDYPHFVRLFPELETGDPMRTAAQWEADVMPTMLVVDRSPGLSPAGAGGGGVDAYVYYQLLDDTAYVRHLVVAPNARRQGLGKKLLDIVQARARERGLTTFCLNVLPTNAPAVALYESYGMRAVHTMIVVRIPWSAVVGDAPAGARPMLPSDDARLEARFTIVPGLLADHRARGRVCVVIEENGDLVAAAVFDPSFPGVPVFRAARPDLALPLLRGLVAHKQGPHDWVQLITEGQPEIAGALIDAGAREHVRTLHYRTSL